MQIRRQIVQLYLHWLRSSCISIHYRPVPIHKLFQVFFHQSAAE